MVAVGGAVSVVWFAVEARSFTALRFVQDDRIEGYVQNSPVTSPPWRVPSER